jgi:hypothetical protein
MSPPVVKTVKDLIFWQNCSFVMKNSCNYKKEKFSGMKLEYVKEDKLFINYI